VVINITGSCYHKIFTYLEGSVLSDQCMGVRVFCQQSAYILNCWQGTKRKHNILSNHAEGDKLVGGK
jgi:hypothetical protein